MNKNRRQGDRFGRDGGVILLLLGCRVVTGLYGEVVVKTVENFKALCTGVVAMVNSGPDSNGSQLFITTVMASWLDGEHDVFGKVIEGMDTVYAIEGGAGTYSGKPRKKLIIDDLDEMPKSEWEEGSRSSTSAL